MHDHQDDHDRGLAHDLQVIAAQMVARRRALAWLGGAGVTALLAGCSGSSGTDGSTTTSSATTASTGSTTTTTTGTTTTGTTTTGSTTTTSTSGGTCVADPTETNGPYPADGTNTSSGTTSNVLTQSGIVRNDIRSSFITSTTTAQGLQVSLTLTLVDVNAACAALAGYAIYIWHCDATGDYSLYNAPTESYLRGVQVTDANGQVTFTTIFPGCYSGRYPHMHLEVFASLSAATSGRAAKLVTQLAMPSAVATTVYNGDSRYTASIRNFASVSIANDNVFGDDTSAQIAQMTPAMSGSVAGGYAATNTIGLAV